MDESLWPATYWNRHGGGLGLGCRLPVEQSPDHDDLNIPSYDCWTAEVHSWCFGYLTKFLDDYIVRIFHKIEGAEEGDDSELTRYDRSDPQSPKLG